MRLQILVVTTLLLLPALSGCVEEAAEAQEFPQFSAVADDELTYNNSIMAGAPYIVVFSAEWCNSPCYSTLHSIWNTQAELPVLVMSTDPAKRAGGLTLQQWHESANAHDDEENDTGIELSTYAFMKGDDTALEMDITTPGTTFFINSAGIITDRHEGLLDDQELISSYWESASK